MGTFHKSKTVVNGWFTHENSFATGTVWDANDREWIVTVYGFVESEPPCLTALPEDCHDGYQHTEVLRVMVHTSGGGHYEKAIDSFPAETQKQIFALLETDGQPKYVNDCDD